jgi:DNA-binding beta-propeller fold protein YncE
VSERDLQFFRRDLSKDERDWLDPEPAGRQAFRKDCLSPWRAEQEAAALRHLALEQGRQDKIEGLLCALDREKVTQSIGTDQEISHMVALDPKRGRAYTANIGSGSITVLDLGKGVREINIATGDGAEGIAVSASGEHIWVTNRAADTITILDAGTLEPAGEIVSEGFPIRATATSVGQVLVTRARAGDLAIYDAATFDEIRVVSFDIESMDVEDRLFGDRFGDSSVPIGVIVDGSGETAWVAHANADIITEIDLASGAITRMLRAGREPDGMGFSPLDVER